MRATDAGPETEDIVGWAAARAKAQGLVVGDMRRVKEAYAGRMVIPLPEMDRNEDPAVANIIAQSIDQYAGRIASVLPNLYYPALRPGFQNSENKARDRMRANQGWWKYNRMGNKLRQRAYDLVGYSASAVSLSYAEKQNCAKWNIRDPLNTFPLITADPYELTPPNCIFKYKRSLGWLRQNYATEIANLDTGDNCDDTTLFDILEYQDDCCMVQVVLGRAGNYYATSTTDPYAELIRLPNKTGICLVVTAGKVGLSTRKPQFLDAIGIYKAQARIVALEMIAVERGIFPDTYLVSRQNEVAKFVSGPHDGRTGMVNVIQGGEITQTLPPMSQNANMMSSNLERASRISSGTSPDTQGEPQTNVRTGKRGDAILSAVIDVPIQAAQEALAESLEQENIRAVAIAKAYGGSKTTTFYVGNTGKQIVYKANDIFETDNNRVTYAMAGADANGLAVALGQRLSIGTISKHTAMEVDPFVEDVLLEQETIEVESLKTALLAAIDQQAQAGTIPVGDLAAIGVARMSGKSLFEAVDRQQKAAQARQATQAPPPGPGQVSAPETQPGLAAPGQGAEQPEIAPPSASISNLSDVIRRIQSPANVAGQAVRRAGG
jgi:hypothetical protein